MQRKNSFILIISILIVILSLYLFISNLYKNYLFDTLNNIVSNISEYYPSKEQEIMDIILNENKNSDLTKYGINKNNFINVVPYKNLTNKVILVFVIGGILILLVNFIYYNFNRRKIKKEIGIINKYIARVLDGTYEFNIADYNEGELSILKNDIYKVAIKLKELSLYEQKEKLYLMNTLEDISHQLKTPLTALMVINDILKNEDLTKKERKNFLDKETRELEKMEWLITVLLKYSKIDSGSVKLKKEKISALNLIKGSLESISIPLELKDIKVDLDNLNFNLECDINWTKEALINILKNAIEHLNNQGLIVIKGEVTPLYKALIIKDNGSGIVKKDIKNIFKRFYSTNSSKNSIGIGLNMAKMILEKQNAKIEVNSEIGKFTEFKIIFLKNII